MRGCQHTEKHALYRRERVDELPANRRSRGFRRVDDYAYRCNDCGALVADRDLA